MSLIKRLLSGDYRSALAAEASGYFDTAAEHYARAGETEKACQMFLAHADMAREDGAKLDVLGRAFAIAPLGTEVHKRVAQRLGALLLAKAEREGVATERDREKVREAARYLATGGRHEEAGAALEGIGDHAAAADAYREGGLIHRMEYSLGVEEQRNDKDRAVRDAFAGYQAKLRSGDRDGARDELGRCLAASDDQSEYRRLLDELDARLLTGDRVALRRRSAPPITVCATGRASLGRDDLCELSLRAPGVSRHHAEILVTERATDDSATGDISSATQRAVAFSLRDAGSRNGTLLHELPVAGTVPLAGSGELGLGDECPVHFDAQETTGALVLEVLRGVDRGARLILIAPGGTVSLAFLGLPLTLTFRRGRPFLAAEAGRAFLLNGESIAVGEVQLVRDDNVVLGAEEFEVA